MRRNYSTSRGNVISVARVVVQFGSGNCNGFSFLGLNISGTLTANGTAAQPITFTSFTDDATTSWNGLWFLSGASGSVSHANLRFGSPPSNGTQGMVYIATGNALVSVTDSTFTNGGYGVSVSGAGSAPTISGNSFSQDVPDQVRSDAAEPTITGNTLFEAYQYPPTPTPSNRTTNPIGLLNIPGHGPSAHHFGACAFLCT